MAADIRLSKPTCRVIRCSFDELEREIRKRTWYDLVAVTQYGETYTLFFRLKLEPVREHRNGERLLSEGDSP